MSTPKSITARSIDTLTVTITRGHSTSDVAALCLLSGVATCDGSGIEIFNSDSYSFVDDGDAELAAEEKLGEIVAELLNVNAKQIKVKYSTNTAVSYDVDVTAQIDDEDEVDVDLNEIEEQFETYELVEPDEDEE